MRNEEIISNRDCYFIKQDEVSNYKCYKEFPVWTAKDLPEKTVQVNSFAKLNVKQGAILFSAYDERDNLVYEEIFNTKNPQTLLKPNIKHQVKPIGENVECQLQFFKPTI